MSISQSIIIGAVSGIFTSFFIWILAKIFNDLAIPWYQSVVYRGIIIDGEWEGFYENLFKTITKETPKKKVKPHSNIILRQKGHKVEGEQIINVQPGGQEDQKQLCLINGVLRDNNLLISFETKDQARLGTGNYVMKLVEDGRKFEGVCVFISSARGDIFVERMFWTRVD